jgi:hypothetical protein
MYRADRRHGVVQRHLVRAIVHHRRRLDLQQRLRRSPERRQQLWDLREEVYDGPHRRHLDLRRQELSGVVHGFDRDAVQQRMLQPEVRPAQLRAVRP